MVKKKKKWKLWHKWPGVRVHLARSGRLFRGSTAMFGIGVPQKNDNGMACASDKHHRALNHIPQSVLQADFSGMLFAQEALWGHEQAKCTTNITIASVLPPKLSGLICL